MYIYLADMFISDQLNCCCKIATFYWISVNVTDVEKSSPCSVVSLALLGEQGVTSSDSLEEYGSGACALVAFHLYPFCARLMLGCKGLGTASEQQQR